MGKFDDEKNRCVEKRWPPLALLTSLSLSLLALRLIALSPFLSLSVYTREEERRADERENAKCILNSLPLSFPRPSSSSFPTPLRATMAGLPSG